MSWFDHLFGDDDEKDNYQRKYSQRRQKLEEKERRRHALLPENNDIYNRPKGNFRFPLHVDNEDVTSTSNKDTNHSHVPHEFENASNETVVNQDGRRHRRRRNFNNNDETDSSFRSTRNTRKQNAAQQNKTSSFQNDYTSNNHNRRIQNFSTGYDTKDVYYRSGEFKAEEVPSAIFGTKKRHPLENGVIKHDKPVINKENEHKQSKIVTDPLNGYHDKENTASFKTEKQKSNQVANASMESRSNDKAKDNTININNIYASQIVEEIRRERERKVLQRKKFKEALQQKREQDDTDSIQKAIDDMYAEQAKQYVSEPFFQDDSKQSHDEDTTTTDKSNQEIVNELQQDELENTDDFDYEEIDLNHVQSVQAVDEKDVKVVDDKTEHQANEMLSDENSSHEAPDVSEAQYTEIEDETPSDQSENANISKHQHATTHTESEDNDTNHNAQEIQQSQNTLTSNSEAHVEESPVQKIEPSVTHESELDSDKEEAQQADEKFEVDQEADISQSQNDDTPSDAVKEKQTPKKISPPLRKGSKPFNVMMTPSDKRRMRNAQNKSSEPVLRPDIKTTTKVQHSNNDIDKQHVAINEAEHKTSLSTQPSESDSNEHQSENCDTASVQQTQNQGHVTQNIDTLQSSQPTKAPAETINNEHVHGNKPVSAQTSNSHQEGIRKGPNLKLPSLDLLDEPEVHEVDQEWIDEKKQELNDAFYYFNVPAEVKNVTEGPSVTRFELSVEKGVKVSRITALQDDLKMALAAKDIRIEAPIPGTSLVGIEVPNVSPTKVNLKSIIESPKFKHSESKLTVALGNRINNEPLLMDIAKTPHALIAGATGSGKSVCINSILISLLYKNHPEELKLLLIDPKMVELAPYNGLPHLVSPVITDVKAATQSLKWAVDEMEKRYKLFAQYHVRNITAFNKKAPYEHRLPKIVIVIDELADLMMMAPQEVEQSIARIAQKARACGIHMLVATQRPSVNVITGLIKANIPTRIAFMVSSSVDSRTILDSGGAERLLGYGDMLYLGNGMNKPIRVQGSFVSDEEIDEVVDFIKDQREPEYLFEEKELLKQTKEQPKDDLFDEVCRFMVTEGHISTSLIQRHFQIGYNRAARIVDQLEELGYISGSNGSKPREVYLSATEINED